MIISLYDVYFKAKMGCRLTAKILKIILLGLVISVVIMSAVRGAEKSTFNIGDKLKNAQSNSTLTNETYKKLNWEELSPADWDPTAALKGLDLDKLQDADPRAREALIAVGEAWKNAPIIPALNGLRVKIAGFVVPLDVSKKKVKAFLLVPYFGACIHVPPPPSNQVVYALNAKVTSPHENDYLKRAARIQGPITIIGILQTVSAKTSLGAAGYKIEIEQIEEYKAPESN